MEILEQTFETLKQFVGKAVQIPLTLGIAGLIHGTIIGVNYTLNSYGLPGLPIETAPELVVGAIEVLAGYNISNRALIPLVKRLIFGEQTETSAEESSDFDLW